MRLKDEILFNVEMIQCWLGWLTYKASAILFYNKEETLPNQYSRELSDATWLIDKMSDIFIGVFIILQIIGIGDSWCCYYTNDE